VSPASLHGIILIFNSFFQKYTHVTILNGKVKLQENQKYMYEFVTIIIAKNN